LQQNAGTIGGPDRRMLRLNQLKKERDERKKKVAVADCHFGEAEATSAPSLGAKERLRVL
jgi:hypothetical protein